MKTRMDDYVRAWDDHSRRWIYFHRLLGEVKAGRKLNSDEIVHHVDGNKKNNSLSNLVILTQEEHVKLHKPYNIFETRYCMEENCCGKHHALGLCRKHYRKKFPSKWKGVKPKFPKAEHGKDLEIFNKVFANIST